MVLSRSKLSIRADSWLYFTYSMLQSLTQVIPSNDVPIAAAVAVNYNFSEGVGDGVGLNLSAT